MRSRVHGDRNISYIAVRSSVSTLSVTVTVLAVPHRFPNDRVFGGVGVVFEVLDLGCFCEAGGHVRG